jgi:hypothetical protein
VELRCTRYAALQHNSTNNIYFFFALWSMERRYSLAPRCGAYCSAAPRSGTAATLQRRSTVQSGCSAPPSSRAATRLHAAQHELLQHYSALWSSMLAAELLQHSSMAQLHAASAPQRKRWQLPSPSSSGCFGPFFFWLLCFKK